MKKNLCFIIFVLVLIGVVFLVYTYNLSPVNNNDKEVAFEVEKGESFLTIASTLKENNLIRSELFYKLYIKLHNVSGLEAGMYYVSSDMNVKELVKILSGKSKNINVMNITFKEGLHMRKVAAMIADSTNYTEEEVIAVGLNKEFLNEVIADYWFLTNEILDKDIYYPLEGYLFPNTYEFNKDATIEEILRRLLDETNKVLSTYKKDIENSKYTVHEIITLASMIQSEGNNVADFEKMASVFLTRLDKKMKLQSCASAYYGDRKIMGIDEFGDSYQKKNAYNTYVIPALPVGPISNPGEDAIKSVLNPSDTDYLYFASDKNMKVYFSKTYQEHQQTVAQLKKAGNWYGS